MALIRSFTAEDGTHYPTAYSRVITVRCDKFVGCVFVCTYADEAARLADALPIFAEEHCTNPAAFNGDTLAQAYTFIKTCLGFESAVDHGTDTADTMN